MKYGRTAQLGVAFGEDMLIKHRQHQPWISRDAVLMPGAIVSGDVRIDAGAVILAGAIVTSEGAAVRIGTDCIVMEHAVIRGAGHHACSIGDAVVVGPHAHVSGATIESECFVATGATVLNGASLGRGTTVAINAVVHVASRCPAGTFVPIGHVAFGDPATIYGAAEMGELHSKLATLGFTRVVFGFESGHLTNAEATRELVSRYATRLREHKTDRVLRTMPPKS